MKAFRRPLAALLAAFIFGPLASLSAESVSKYNVVWDSPSEDHTGQMPLGNGDIAAGVCAIEDDALYLLLSKNDAYTYNGDIFKTGRLRVQFEPNPFVAGKSFRQTLDLDTGSVLIEADGVRLRVFADANRPVYHLHITSPREISVKATPDPWQRFDSCRWNLSKKPLKIPTQDVVLSRDDKLIWYFAAGDRSVYSSELEFYGVPHMEKEIPDPYRFNTFGNLVESPDLTLKDNALQGSGKVFDVRIHALTQKEPEAEDWISSIEGLAAEPVDLEKDWEAHCQWWSNFWGRSWIQLSDNTLPADQQVVPSSEGYTKKREASDNAILVAQSYNVFRYMMACQSRGRIQTKFNGGLFTQPLRYSKKPRMISKKVGDNQWITHEDDRRWGRRFTFQNQRLFYWPMLMSGDSDLMKPFFDYYWNLLPIRRAITKAWFGHEGTYYRENIEPTGGERDCSRNGRDTDPEVRPLKTPPGGNEGKGYYHSYYFTSGLEIVAMMLEYVKYTGDTDFRDDVLVPFAREILLFFDKHYARDDNGKLRIDPGMVLETWWIAVNAAPDVSGLLHCLDGLLEMKAGSSEDITAWKAFRKEIPDVHLHEIEGRTAIAPAYEWDLLKNSENGLLYPVFPFRRFGIGMGTKDIVEWTCQHRTNPDRNGCRCWSQDQIFWSYAGNAPEAQRGLIRRFRSASETCRFPIYGDAPPDSVPDFDHFGSGSTALQRMLVQEAGDKILLLPAWPANWNADFKLHVAGNTVVTGKVVDGKLEEWDISPASRKAKVVVYDPQPIPAP